MLHFHRKGALIDDYRHYINGNLNSYRRPIVDKNHASHIKVMHMDMHKQRHYPTTQLYNVYTIQSYKVYTIERKEKMNVCTINVRFHSHTCAKLIIFSFVPTWPSLRKVCFGARASSSPRVAERAHQNATAARLKNWEDWSKNRDDLTILMTTVRPASPEEEATHVDGELVSVSPWFFSLSVSGHSELEGVVGEFQHFELRQPWLATWLWLAYHSS